MAASFFLAGIIAASAQKGVANAPVRDAEMIVGVPQYGEGGVREKTSELMARPGAPGTRSQTFVRHSHLLPDRRNLRQDSGALFESQWPAQSTQKSARAAQRPVTSAPQTVGTTFDGVTGPNETSSFPPDTMGAVGPTQFVIFVNGRLRSFNKTSGTGDGVLNINPDTFFALVLTPVTPPAVNFTSNPQIRYDRLSNRWFLTIIDVPSSSGATIGDMSNRVLIAVSDAASNGVISGATVWTFYFVQQNTVGGGNTGEFLDFPSVGVDNNALYIGGNMYDAASGAFITSSGFVVRKSSVLNGGPIVVTAFRGLATGGDRIDSPLGVDNFDPAATEGYFIGPSSAAFGRLLMRRVTDPGGTPSISANLSITVNATSFPITVDHLGDTNGLYGNLDAVDDRLFAAHIRNGRLWTAHNIAVTSAGVATNSDAQRRDAVRWYELNVPVGSGTPTLVQSGTVFDSAPTVAAARQYWIPSVMVSGQGHAAFGYSTAGTNFHIDAATNGRLAGDALGSSGSVAIFTASSTAYNPPADPGPMRRWGDYSFTSLDPNDDMTIWTVQEFCDGTNTYGIEVAKLLAPPPASPASASPASLPAGQSSVSTTITGTSVAGSGFFDPGVAFANRIAASVTGGVTVNSVTYIDPNHVTLDLNTTGASQGAKNVTITNPDGQALTGTGILTISGGAALQLNSAVSRKIHGAAGTFDIDLPLSGAPGIECRNGAGNYTFVFTFNNNVVSGSAGVTTGTGSAGTPIFSGNTMTVNLTGVTDVQQITVTLIGVTDTFSQVLPNTPVNAKMLIGDTNGNSSVNSSDIAQTKAQSGATATAANFREDVTVNGSISSSDISLVKTHVGSALP
jgi:hypothetical protein